MILRNLSLGLAMTTVASALMAPCEPEPPEPTQWSEGNYIVQNIYRFSFRDDPYVMTSTAATSGDDALGNVWGEFRWLFWLDSDSYMSGEPAACIFTESLVGEGSQAGAIDIDYSLCEGCEPYSEIKTFDTGLSGPACTDALIEFFYSEGFSGESDGAQNNVWGYRHAESDGWPPEFVPVADALESDGFVGAIYDLSIEGDTLAPTFIVAPLPEDGTRSMETRPLPAHLMIPRVFGD